MYSLKTYAQELTTVEFPLSSHPSGTSKWLLDGGWLFNRGLS